MTTFADSNARHRLRTDLDTTFFVEAGAGTGKTTMLVSRVVELIAAGPDTLQIERLAAITFTEAAAAELRDRIRQELERAALERAGSEADHLQKASREVDLASIQTIHAFAGALLRTYPLEAHLPPNFATLDEIQQERGFGDRFRAWLYDDVPDPAYPQRRAAVRRVLALGMTPDQIRELATRLENYRDLIDAETVWPTPFLEDGASVANDWGARLKDLECEADHALDANDKLVAELHRLQVVAQRMLDVHDQDEALRLLQQCKPKHTDGIQANWPPGLCKQIKSVLKQCSDSTLVTLNAYRAAALADLLQHLRDFTLASADKRLSDGELTFHDLLARARDLLRDNPAVRRRAQARFDRVFVDEFQDTDPLQVEIAWFLTARPDQAEERDWKKLQLEPGKLFIVGDPKQSIYRFRRADIGIYHQVYAQVEHASHRVLLSQSFRSPEPLVDWFNFHFQDDMRFKEGVQPAYARLDPRLTDGTSRGSDFGVRHFGKRVEAAGVRWSEEAQTVAQLVHQMVNGTDSVTDCLHVSSPWSERSDADEDQLTWCVADQGMLRRARYNDICVLIPTRTNLRRLERAFQNADVPYRVESGWLVLHTQEVRDLLSCLRAIDDPSDQVALVAALRSPAYACSDVDLLRWVESGGRLDYEWPGRGCDGPVLRGLSSLREFHDVRMDRTPAATAEEFIRDRMLAVQAFGSVHPRDALRRLRYVVAQARTLAGSGQPTLRALCDWLESRQREQYYDAESAVPDADEDAVRFMTVHGSKGLEFPIVILTGLGVATSRVGPQSVDLVPNYKTNVLEVRCGDFTTANYVRDTEKAMYEAEQKRLLYVATTRARDHLVLSLYHGKDPCHATRILSRLAARPELSRELLVPTPSPTPGAPAASLIPAGPGRMKGTSSPPTAGTDPVAAAGADTAAAAAQHKADEDAWLAHRETVIAALSNQTIISPSQLAHEPPQADRAPPPEPDPNTVPRRIRKGRGGSALGRAVHAVLQSIDLATLADLDLLAESAATEENVLDHLDQIKHCVRNAAASGPVQRALASARYWREIPVGISLENGSLLEGAIDLLYEDSDGSLVVVDYKTDHVPPERLASRLDHYRSQGEAYALAIWRATNQRVSRIEFIFVAAAPDHPEVMVIGQPDLQRAATAIARAID
jgi:ATP-dependent helicase/nuclease subunit A